MATSMSISPTYDAAKERENAEQTPRDHRSAARSCALARLLLAIMQGQELLAKTGMAPAALAQIGGAAISKLLGGPPAKGGQKARRRSSREKRG